MPDATLNIAGHGMTVAEQQYEALVNNLVNPRSTGYKTVGAVVKSFPEFLAEVENSQAPLAEYPVITKGPMYPKVTGVYSDFSQGQTIVTDRHLDFAIEGEGFFNIQTNSGTGLTRDGRFVLNGDGVLVTAVGSYPVLGEKGPIFVPPGTKFSLLPSGQIIADGNVIDQLKITAFEKENLKYLENSGGSFWRVPVDKDVPPKNDPVYQLRQGVLEVSNVKIMDEMLKMIVIQKSHEANVNVAKARDTLLQRTIEMGAPIK